MVVAKMHKTMYKTAKEQLFNRLCINCRAYAGHRNGQVIE